MMASKQTTDPLAVSIELEYRDLEFSKIEDGWSQDIRQISPVITIENVKEYLINSNDKSFDKDTLRAYKALRAYNLYEAGHIHSVQYNQLSSSKNFCIVRSKCFPSQKTNKDYTTYVCLDKVTGVVYGGTCQCVAGLGQACTHLAALLFSLVDFFERGCNYLPDAPGTTEVICKWTAVKNNKVIAKPLSDIPVYKPKYGKKRKALLDPHVVYKRHRSHDLSEDEQIRCLDLRQKLLNCNRNCDWLTHFRVSKTIPDKRSESISVLGELPNEMSSDYLPPSVEIEVTTEVKTDIVYDKENVNMKEMNLKLSKDVSFSEIKTDCKFEPRSLPEKNESTASCHTQYNRSTCKILTKSLVQDRCNFSVPPISKGVSNTTEIITISDSQHASVENSSTLYWNRDLGLTYNDMLTVVNGSEFSDMHIYAAQKLLKQQYPHISGLQSTVLPVSQLRSISVESIQIHYNGHGHWVTSSNVGGKVQIFDSSFGGHIPDELLKQVTHIYGLNKHSCSIECPPVQQQVGNKDCGLFAIAFAVEIAEGNVQTIQSFSFDQCKMRNHFVHCVNNNTILPFPKFSGQSHEDYNSFLQNKIIVNDKQAKEIEQETRLQAKCSQWFYHRSVRITASNFGVVYKRRKFTNLDPFISQILHYRSFTSIETKWGREHEKIALEEFSNEMSTILESDSLQIQECGFVVNPKWPKFGATPDATIVSNTTGNVEAIIESNAHIDIGLSVP
ncbi:uncharacterized protein [Ptychodera flava]|uniref:uncharacterized protein n=1 Tax=Ptychodera flava TaxID=63121 RepID=UPI00396A1513